MASDSLRIALQMYVKFETCAKMGSAASE